MSIFEFESKKVTDKKVVSVFERARAMGLQNTLKFNRNHPIHDIPRSTKEEVEKKPRKKKLYSITSIIDYIGSELSIPKLKIELAKLLCNTGKYYLDQSILKKYHMKEGLAVVLLLEACKNIGNPYDLSDFAPVTLISKENLEKTTAKINQAVKEKMENSEENLEIDPLFSIIGEYCININFGIKNYFVTKATIETIKKFKKFSLASDENQKGVWGAAIYLAAKEYDLPKTFSQISDVVKVNPETIMKLEKEFQVKLLKELEDVKKARAAVHKYYEEEKKKREAKDRREKENFRKYSPPPIIDSEYSSTSSEDSDEERKDTNDSKKEKKVEKGTFKKEMRQKSPEHAPTEVIVNEPLKDQANQDDALI